MQLRLRHIARNVFSNWFVTAANMAVGFFLAPFIVHRLGNAAYGVWVLAVSSVNYLSLLDLGMRSSVLRFISKGHAVGDHELASESLSAALWVRLQVSGVVMLFSLGLAAAFPHIFKVPAELGHEAQYAVLIIGASLMVYMSLGTFGGVISGLNRYDLQGVVTLVQLAIRVIGVVLVLRSGRGIVAIALCEFAAALVGNVLLAWLALRIYPQLRLRIAKPKSDILRDMWVYSFYAFVTTIAVQLVYQTDNLVVGTFISATAVTFYSIGNSLCRYTDQFASALAQTFVPAASSYEAAGETEGLRRLYYAGSFGTMALAFPVLITLLTRGHTFIGLWMGREYAQVAGNILMILVVPLLFAYANRITPSIAFGMGKHKKVAIWSIIEGVANLTLSITLVHWFGIYGVALGTLIPSLFVQLIIWPPFINELCGIKLSDVFLRVWAPMFLGAVPFALASYELDKYFPPRNILMFMVQTLAILPIFLSIIALIYRKSFGVYILPHIKNFLVARPRAT